MSVISHIIPLWTTLKGCFLRCSILLSFVAHDTVSFTIRYGKKELSIPRVPVSHPSLLGNYESNHGYEADFWWTCMCVHLGATDNLFLHILGF